MRVIDVLVEGLLLLHNHYQVYNHIAVIYVMLLPMLLLLFRYCVNSVCIDNLPDPTYLTSAVLLSLHSISIAPKHVGVASIDKAYFHHMAPYVFM